MDQNADPRNEKLIAAARGVIAEIGRHLDIDASVELWSGERVPLGRKVTSPLAIRIASPGVISSVLRHPTLDRIIRHYVQGQLDIVGGTLLDLGERFSGVQSRRRLKGVNRVRLLQQLSPFLFQKADLPTRARDFIGNESGKAREIGENKHS